jgi:hypothetical protein
VETLEVGETWAYTLTVGCGGSLFFYHQWWVATERTFEHPNYRENWPVEILNQGPVDGPDARIQQRSCWSTTSALRSG